MEKYEARLQCTGEAIYTNDIPILPSEVHAAFVYSTMANCELDIVDTTEAMVRAKMGSLRFLWVPSGSLEFHIWIPYLGSLCRFLIQVTYLGSLFGFLIQVPYLGFLIHVP